MAGIPFKACILDGDGGSVQVGVVARNYKNFREQLQTKYGLEKDFQVYLEDGTQVCDEEYFDVLEPQTKLTVIQRGANSQSISDADRSRGEKRLAPADSATSLPSKRVRLISQTENDPRAVSASTADPVVSSDNASLISSLRIASVSGNVNMRMSPPHPHSPVQTQTTQFHVSGTQPLSHVPILTQEPSLTQAPHCTTTNNSTNNNRWFNQLHHHQQQQLYHQQQQLQQQQLYHRLQQPQYPQAQVQPHLTSPPGAPSVAYTPSIHPQQTLAYHTVQRTPSHRGMQVFQGPYVYSRSEDNPSHLQTQAHPQPHQQMILVSPPASQPQLAMPQLPPTVTQPSGQLMLTQQVPSMADMFQQKRLPLPPPLLAMSMANHIRQRNSAAVVVSPSSQVRALRAAGHSRLSVSPIVNSAAQFEYLTPEVPAQLNHLCQTTLTASTADIHSRPPTHPQPTFHTPQQPSSAAPVAVSSSSQVRALRAAGHSQFSVSPIVRFTNSAAQFEHLTPEVSAQLDHLRQSILTTSTADIHNRPPTHPQPTSHTPQPPDSDANLANNIKQRNSASVAVSSSSQVRALRAAEHSRLAVSCAAQFEHLTPEVSAQLNYLRQTTLTTSARRPQPTSHTLQQPSSDVMVLPISKLSVVNCADFNASASSTEDADDEGSLCIVEKSSSACSTPSIPLDTPPLPQKERPTFSFEASISQSTHPVPPSRLASCMHTAPKEAVKVSLQDNADSETSRNDDMNVESPSDIEVEDSSGRRFSASSPDDGYASSTSFGSLNDLTSKLPFADFESDRMEAHKELPSLTKTSAPENHEQFMKGEKQIEESSLAVEGRLDSTATVDTCLYQMLMQESKEIVVIDVEDVCDSSPAAPPSPLLNLMLRIPVHCSKEGKIVCQGLTESLQTTATGEESNKLEIDGGEVRSAEEKCEGLVVSIPVCQLASGGITCLGFLAARGEDNGDLSKEDELKVQSGAKNQPTVRSEQEQAVQVQEYASEELVVTSCSHSNSCSHNNRHMRSKRRSKRRRFCTQADITKAVNEIVANLAHAQILENCVGNEQLLIAGEEMELDRNGGSNDGEEILLVSSDFGNEVVVSDEQDDDNESESEVEIIMSSLAPPREEIETEVVQMECLSEDYSECINCTESNIPRDQHSATAAGSEVQELSKKIEGLLELADLLTTMESKTIRDFFNGKPSDPRKGLQTYCLKNLPDNQAVFLEINFETRKWRGFVSQTLLKMHAAH